ncbi:MAG: metallophosphoesterase, partial [Nanoarchaeota archaeon]
MRHLIVYTADLHGNETQYQKLIKYAIDKSANSIIIGGDIAPKEDSQNYMENQRKFIQNELPKLILPLKQQLPNSNLFLLMGNDDCWANLEELEQNDPKLYRIIHNKRINDKPLADKITTGQMTKEEFLNKWGFAATN